ncbi:MAG: hypothetical protein SGARI_005667, partial [Bacillariaceae sp.]
MMSSFARSSLLALATALTLSTVTNAHEHISVGDTICVEGYVMDQFCIDNGVMIDNGRTTLEEPQLHSVHCLVDVSVCVATMFEILADPPVEGSGSNMYGRGFAIDETQDNGAGKEAILDVARTAGNKSRGCTTCYADGPQSKAFRAVLTATVLEVAADKDSPTLIHLDSVMASNDMTSE